MILTVSLARSVRRLDGGNSAENQHTNKQSIVLVAHAPKMLEKTRRVEITRFKPKVFSHEIFDDSDATSSTTLLVR
jgi:hypothetical protein